MTIPVSRRALFQAAAAAPLAAASQAPLLPTVPLGKYPVSRLIIGSNPFSGYAYSLPSLAQHMRDWFTPENVEATLRSAERNGINTHQLSYLPEAIEQMAQLRESGSKLQYLVLSGGKMRDEPALIGEVAKRGPMAIVHHGGATDQRFKAGEHAKVKEFLARVRDSGVLVGMSSHLPENIAYAEEHGWDVDFYMASFHQLTRNAEETRKLTGEMGIGTSFLEGDPARMCKVIRAVKRPCLAFKILAAGRVAEKRGGLEEAFRFAFENIKPTDAVIVGVYPRFKDEVAENAAIVRRLLAS
ncbi:MAG TPA: hypothetical protein PLF84_17455 [Bryobacteraceae bacterium]|nr:hypothetical protein [Bryobacterales bacterium]HRJ20838.1 hypothetical protein [Bryobacteraceae bacterium]